MPKPIVDRLHARWSRRRDAGGRGTASPESRRADLRRLPEMHDRVARELALWTKTVDEEEIPKQ